MAQERGGNFRGERGDYETDDLRFRNRPGAGGYQGEQGRGYGGNQSRGSQQSGFDYSSGRQYGGGQSESDERRSYGEQRGYGQDWHQDDWSGVPRSIPAPGGFGSTYAPSMREDYAMENRRGYPGRSQYGYGGDYRGRSEGGRGFWDKAADEVSSWFGDEDAERRRKQDHRGRGPKGYARSDERIREDVNDRLTDDWSVDASDIEVEVSGREVTLSGEVASRSDKRRAEDIAESVSGVSHVQNNLRVKQHKQAPPPRAIQRQGVASHREG
jgi:osmotically-inducible protein OsmY